jgi:hypothetical protein
VKSVWGKNSIKHVRDLWDENVMDDILSHGESLVGAKHWGRFNVLWTEDRVRQCDAVYTIEFERT